MGPRAATPPGKPAGRVAGPGGSQGQGAAKPGFSLPLPGVARERPARRGTGFYPVPESLLEAPVPVFAPPPMRGAGPPVGPPVNSSVVRQASRALAAEDPPGLGSRIGGIGPARSNQDVELLEGPSEPSTPRRPISEAEPSGGSPGPSTPGGSSREMAASASDREPVRAPQARPGPAQPREAIAQTEALPGVSLTIDTGSSEDDDLPAPVASTRPFTLPKTARRITVPAMTAMAETHELESSAELELPSLASLTSSQLVETVVASPRPPTLSRTDNFDLDLDDLHEGGPSPPADWTGAPEDAAASAARGALRAPPRRRPLQGVAPVAAQVDPPALASVGLVALTLALAGLWWFYFTRAPGLTVDDRAVRGDMSRRTYDQAYLNAQEERLAADHVGDYQAALAEAEAHGDRLGRAEAALCMHLRYGPDLVRRSAAAVWGQQAAPGDPRATRVAALALLASGDAVAAEASLAGEEEPRALLYRALAQQQRGDHAAAIEATRELRSRRPDDLAATLIALTEALAARRDAPLTDLQAAAEAHRDHPLYQQALLRALLGRGRLAQARTLAEQQRPIVGASEAHNAKALVLQGQVAAATGEARRARELVDRARRLAPQDLATQLAQVRVLLAIGDPGRAQQELTPLLRESTDAESLLLQADLAILAGNEGAATRAIDRLVNDGRKTVGQHEQHEQRERARVALLRGRIHAMRGRNDDAVAAFTAALAERPEAAAAIGLAELRVRLGAPEPLAPLVQTLERLRQDPRERVRPELRALRLAHANLLYETGRKDQAVAVLDEALRADPDDNAAQLRRGALAVEQGRTPAGRADLVAVFERTGGFPGLVGPLGRLYLREGDLPALQRLLLPHAEDPQAPDEVIVMSALLRLAQSDRDGAEQSIDKVLQRSPMSWEAHLAKARVLYERERMTEAQAEIRLARPRVADAEVELWAGKIAERSGKPQEALSAYRRARQLDPSLQEAGFLLGRALLGQGLAREAINELQAVTHAPNVPHGAHLALGLALREREQRDEALQSFTHAIGDEPNPEEALYWAGRTAAELGHEAEAASHLGRAVELAGVGTPWLADAQLWLGRARHRLGDRDQARGPLLEYLRLAGPKAPARAEAERLLRER